MAAMTNVFIITRRFKDSVLRRGRRTQMAASSGALWSTGGLRSRQTGSCRPESLSERWRLERGQELSALLIRPQRQSEWWTNPPSRLSRIWFSSWRGDAKGQGLEKLHLDRKWMLGKKHKQAGDEEASWEELMKPPEITHALYSGMFFFLSLSRFLPHDSTESVEQKRIDAVIQLKCLLMMKERKKGWCWC